MPVSRIQRYVRKTRPPFAEKESGKETENAHRIHGGGDVRRDIATEDISGIAKASGILTATGSPTSHAAVVARLGKVLSGGLREAEIRLPGAIRPDRRTDAE